MRGAVPPAPGVGLQVVAGQSKLREAGSTPQSRLQVTSSSSVSSFESDSGSGGVDEDSLGSGEGVCSDGCIECDLGLGGGKSLKLSWLVSELAW
jgi:hypothetical protein